LPCCLARLLEPGIILGSVLDGAWLIAIRSVADAMFADRPEEHFP
jgi:hypothetical protein